MRENAYHEDLLSNILDEEPIMFADFGEISCSIDYYSPMSRSLSVNIDNRQKRLLSPPPGLQKAGEIAAVS